MLLILFLHATISRCHFPYTKWFSCWNGLGLMKIKIVSLLFIGSLHALSKATLVLFANEHSKLIFNASH